MVLDFPGLTKLNITLTTQSNGSKGKPVFLNKKGENPHDEGLSGVESRDRQSLVGCRSLTSQTLVFPERGNRVEPCWDFPVGSSVEGRPN